MFRETVFRHHNINQMAQYVTYRWCSTDGAVRNINQMACMLNMHTPATEHTPEMLVILVRGSNAGEAQSPIGLP